MKEIIGSFFFRVENGNFIGHYTNTTMSLSLPETATRIPTNPENDGQAFIGQFNSSPRCRTINEVYRVE